MFKVFKNIYNLVNFDKLSYKQLATPSLIKQMMIQPQYKHNRKTQVNLYQGKRHHSGVQTCFSEKKSIKHFRVNTFKKIFHSAILDRKIKVTVSSAAFKTMRKYGGFDNYMLCMDPKKLDSNYGNYIRTLMIRKMQNPNMIVPYIVRTKPYKKLRGKQYHYNKLVAKYINKPVYGLDRYQTGMPKFGYHLDEMDQQRYKKFMQIKKMMEGQEENKVIHPLLKQLQKEVQMKQDPQIARLAAEAREKYLTQKRYKKVIKKKFENDEKDYFELMKEVEIDFDTQSSKF